MPKFAHVLQIIRAALFLMLTMGLVLAVTAVLAGAPRNKPLSGTLTVEQYQLAWILNGNLGGFGMSKIEATDEVYGLKRIEEIREHLN